MKKSLLMGAFIALLFLAGCSKQPSLENATEVNNTKQNQTKQVKNIEINKNSKNSNESVNTENANVEEEVLNNGSSNENGKNNSVEEVKSSSDNKNFAKKLSNIVVYFDFDKYNIKQSEWPKVQKLADLIKDNNANYTIRIEGNCDEWGTEEYNYALGLKRANSVRNALIKLGVDTKKLTIISYGELNPVCTAHARWCWRLNRRDNFTYLP